MNVSIEELKNSELYSEELNIELRKNTDEELFKWFLASILFGARIQAKIAKNTYKTFEKYDLLKPKKILDAGRDYLVSPIMREGGYVRYDGKTSDQILKNYRTILDKYNGSLLKIHSKSNSNKELEKNLKKFHGIGSVTVNIFLRELRPIWEKANPEPLDRVKNIAGELDIDLSEFNRKSWDFVRVEAGLIRLREKVEENKK